MMKKIIYGLLLFLHIIVHNSFGQITFQKTYGGSNDERPRYATQTSDSGYMICGDTKSFGVGGGYTDVYLIRTNGLGDTLWTRTFGGIYDDYGSPVQQTFDGGFIVAGATFYGTGAGVYLIKMDSTGNLLWTKTLGGNSTDYGTNVRQTSDSGLIIIGFTLSFGAAGENVYLIKTDKTGNILWTKTFGGGSNDEGFDVQVTSDNGLIIFGETYSFGVNGGDRNIYVIRTDSVGDLVWSKSYGGTDDDLSLSGQQTSDGGFMIAGITRSFGTGEYDAFLLKIDTSGNREWSKTYAGTDDYICTSVHLSGDGGFIIAGTIGTAGDSKCFLIKTDTSGVVEWSKFYGGTMNEGGSSVLPTNDHGYILCASTKSFGAGNSDLYLIKTDSLGNSGCNEHNFIPTVTSVIMQMTTPATLVSTGGALTPSPATVIGYGASVSTPCIGLTATADLKHAIDDILIFPNPVYDKLTVESKSLNDGYELCDVSGKLLLKNSVATTRFNIDMQFFPSGIYFLTVNQKDNQVHRKIIKE